MSFLRRHTPLPMGPPRVHERRQGTASESSTPGLPWRPEDEKFPKTKRTLHKLPIKGRSTSQPGPPGQASKLLAKLVGPPGFAPVFPNEGRERGGDTRVPV